MFFLAVAAVAVLCVTKLGPEHVKFIQYRPVLANDKLKSGLGYAPRFDARAVFDRYLQSLRSAP